MILIADAVLPMTQPPIQPGAVALQGPRIAEVGSPEELCDRFPDLQVRELNGSLLMPGLVNAHTHLELTLIKDRLPVPSDFISWILAMIQEKKKLTENEMKASVRAGIKMSLSSGTTCVGDIGGIALNLRLFRQSGLRAVLFHEVLGGDPEDPEQWKGELNRFIRERQSESGPLITIGLSPHAPYSISEQRMRILSDYLQEAKLPYSIHIAESREEMEYFMRHGGKIKSRLFPAVGWTNRPDPGRASTPLAFLDGFGLVSERLLAVHGVHLTPEDMVRIKEQGARLVICPRSNHELRVGMPPVETLMQHGVPLALGTDSLASSPSLSLWDEMRFLYTHHRKPGELSAGTILQMATLGGAQALGLVENIGSLESGKQADLIAVEWNPAVRRDLTADLIEKTGDDQIRMVMVAGKILIDR